MIAVARRFRSIGVTLLPLLALAAPPLHASGFAIDNQGVRAMGFAGAYVAQAADPSAIFFNAAGIAFLKERQIYLSGGLGSLGTDFTGEGPNPIAGTGEKTKRLLTILPSVYYTHQVSERLVLGVGFNSPFGYRAEWQNPDAFTGRFICLDCEIRSWGVNPTLAYRIEDRLAVGVGLDVRLSSFRLSQRLLASPNPFPVPTDVAELTIDSGTDIGMGFNAGLLASPSETVSIGLAYRHKVKATYDGTASFTQILTGNAAVDALVAASLQPQQAVQVAHYFPAHFAAGIAVRPGKWTVEGDVAWTFWSAFDQVAVAFPQSPTLDYALPQNYEDVLQSRLGIEYLWSERWAVRGGYSYDHGPQPTETVSPFLHDSNRHGFGLGGSWKQGNLRLDFMGRYLRFRSRSTRGSNRYDYNGRYDTDSFQIGIALSQRF
jgi:long-chain fatty acid transport protein